MRALQASDDDSIDFELLAHRYSWESYHSILNIAGGALIPPSLFSRAFDLRGIAQSFNQTLPDGTYAALSFSAPSGFKGHILYLREDLLLRYSAGRKIIWSIWGEKQLDPYPNPAPDWLVHIQRSGVDVWRYFKRHDEFTQALSVKTKPNRSKL